MAIVCIVLSILTTIVIYENYSLRVTNDELMKVLNDLARQNEQVIKDSQEVVNEAKKTIELNRQILKMPEVRE